MTSACRRALARFLLPLAVLVAAATPTALTSGQAPTAFRSATDDRGVPGEVLVKFRGAMTQDAVAGLAREFDADRHRPVGAGGVHLLHSRRASARDLATRLSKRPDVAYAEPNYILRALDGPGDPRFPELWGLQNLGQAVNGGLPGKAGADVHAVPAWTVSTGSTAAVVAVVDTGIDYTHADLAANVWSAPSAFTVTIGGVRITCAAGTHGFNAITKTCDPMDDHNHGTHVSGTIGAAGNNDVGVVGVNWTTSIMGAKFLAADGSGTTADAIDALEFIIQAKAFFAGTAGANVRVLSNSWGGDDFSQALLDQIVRAGDNDMLFVAAAGNSGLPNDLFPNYPSSYEAPNVIAVAATDNADRRAYFSNYGATTVHLGAPGVDVLSTTIGNTYSFFSGTSMATPHVSGAAALILSACSLDTAELKGEILNSVDPVADLTGATITGGRLNVNNAVRGCSALPSVPADLTATAGDSRVALAWSAVAGATSYHVKRSLVPGGPYASLASPATPSYADTSVVNDVTYYYVVSAANRLGEGADSDEVGATPKVPADLVIAALTAPAGAAGAVIVVADTTRNQGPGVAGPSMTRFYLSANSVLDAADLPLIGSRAVPALAAGTSSAGSTPVTLPADLAAGNWYLIARADADAAVVETSESNNTVARSISIGPDLVVSAVQVPSAIAPGATVSITDTTRNQGAGAAGGSITRFYLSTNLGLDGTDTLLDGSRAVPPLPAGASSTGSTNVTFPANLPVGTCFLIVKSDADGAVAEAIEGNNTLARAFQSGADLVVPALSGPAFAAAGSTIVVADTTKNQGAGAAGPSSTRFYVSADASRDASDPPLGSRAIPALAAGASSSGSASITIPADLAAGAYYLIAAADADATIPETLDTNNATARTLAVGPDLVVAALQAPPTIAPGAALLIADTTKNQGAAAAGASITRFYLSRDASLDATDLLLDGSRVVPSLAAGASSSGSTTVTIPADLAVGVYYLIAKCDAEAAIVEASETNNTALRTTQSGADLIVSSLTAPSSTASGATIIITDTTKNQGAGVAAPSATRFFLSSNASLDAGDIALEGSRTVPSLAASASSTGSTLVTLPAGLAAGTYYVIAQADADAAVVETFDTNNTKASSMSVGPDLVVSAVQIPGSVSPGSALTITETTRNLGAGTAGPSTTRFYLSTNLSLDATDVELGSRAVLAVTSGGSSTGSTVVTMPAGLAAGTYYLIAKADADDAVAESSEGNNPLARAIQVTSALLLAGGG